jgi:hypothetical protein
MSNVEKTPADRSDLQQFSDLLALIYHEARNVRHLVRQGLIPEQEWRSLISLPANRIEAWKRVSQLRDAAYAQASPDGVLKLFQNQFHVCLYDIRKMFANDNWRHAKAYGGNAWAGITDFAIALAAAIRERHPDETEYLLAELSKLRHNNGFLMDKLVELETANVDRGL